MKPQQTITISNIEILAKDNKSLSYRIIGEDKHYRVSMRDVVRIEYVDDEPVIKVRV